MTFRNRVDYSSAVYYFLLCLIILFSFLTFSYKFYPLLNADMAINILMTPGYQFPQDLYAWGQDRGGTLIPLLSHWLGHFVPISTVSVVSIVHFLILIIGFLATSSFLKSGISRILLAIAWFFPPWHFIDFVLFPFGTQFSLFMTGMWLIMKCEKEKNLILRHLLLSISCILMILSVWVSESGIIMIVLFVCFSIYNGIRKNNILIKDWLLSILHIFLWVAIGILFIYYAKSNATRIDVYSDQPFNNLNEIGDSLMIIFTSLIDVFTFSSENFIESIYAWMLFTGILFIILSAIFRNKEWLLKIDRRWFLFFLLNGILTFIMIILSHWAFLNGVGRRYFVLVYISFVLAVLFIIESFIHGKLKNTIYLITTLMVLTAAISSCYTFYCPKHIPSRIKVLSEFQSLGNIGLIAEYWNSYLSATPDPVSIKATPHDKDYVRNFRLVEEVFAQPRIYIIKDMWMDTFPDTLHQFGRTLIRKGDSFYIGQCWVNQYELVHP